MVRRGHCGRRDRRRPAAPEPRSPASPSCPRSLRRRRQAAGTAGRAPTAENRHRFNGRRRPGRPDRSRRAPIAARRYRRVAAGRRFHRARRLWPRRWVSTLRRRHAAAASHPGPFAASPPQTLAIAVEGRSGRRQRRRRSGGSRGGRRWREVAEARARRVQRCRQAPPTLAESRCRRIAAPNHAAAERGPNRSGAGGRF